MQPLKEYLEPGTLPRRPGEPRSLMSRRQPLGVLPTLWFWRELRTERPLLSMFVGLWMGVLGASASWVLLAAGVSLPVGFVVTLCLPYLALGLLERGLRSAVVRRRRALARGARGELSAAVSHAVQSQEEADADASR